MERNDLIVGGTLRESAQEINMSGRCCVSDSRA